MEITYIAHSCIKIKGKDLTLVIDPYNPDYTGYKLPKLNADVVLVSHNHEDHNFKQGVEDYKLLVDGPGEYEIKDVYIYGIPTFHDATQGSERGKNTMYLIYIDGFTILHCGDLGHELESETLENISNLDVMIIPVGGTYTLDSKTATKVISSLEPIITIPMHYKSATVTSLSANLEPVSEFLDEMGIKDNGELDKLKLNKKTDLPDESQVIVLTPTHG